MNISRKEFFRQSLRSLGEAVVTVGDALKAPVALPIEIRDQDDFESSPREDLVAMAHNEQCLARSCGCFSCAERCELEAVKIIPGVGIRINQQLCNGCGICQYVCPVEPKAVVLIPR